MRGAPPLPGLLLNVEVDPAYRSRGIGTRLLEVGDAATDLRLPTLVMIPEADARSMAFATQHGFVERDRQSESKLDLTAFGPGRFAATFEAARARGIEFRIMAEVDSLEMRRRLFELANRVTDDMPSKEPMASMTYDEFTASWLDAPHSRPDLMVVAFDGGAPVAVSMVNVYPGGTGYNWMTGVLSSHRGRGLTTKAQALRHAKNAEVTEVRTNNHERNAPMLAINQRLGYETLPAMVWLVRDA